MAMTIEEAHAALTAPGSMFEMETVEIDGHRIRSWKNAPPSLRAVLEQSRRPRSPTPLFEHPEVSDVAVIGVPHDVLGEEVGAVVLRTPGSTVTAEELQEHVRQRLAAFKVPAHVFFREEPMPRNPQGKILKRELKQELLEA